MKQLLEILYFSEDTVYKWIPEEVLKTAKEKVASAHTLSLVGESCSVRMNQEREASQIQQTETLPQINTDLAKKQIQDNYTKIKKYLDPRYDLLDLLFEKDILTHEKHKYIRRLGEPRRVLWENF